MPRLDPEGVHLASLLRAAEVRGRRVLEVGCGDGRLTTGLACAGAAVVAFDSDAAAIERARWALPDALAHRIEYRVASAQLIELEPAAFDVLVFSWSLCCVHPGAVGGVLDRMLEALRPGGIVLDLQTRGSPAVVEADGGSVAVLRSVHPGWARASAAAVDARVRSGILVEEAVEDVDVRKHFADAAELEEHAAAHERLRLLRPLPAGVPLVAREACRLRRLRRASALAALTALDLGASLVE